MRAAVAFVALAAMGTFALPAVAESSWSSCGHGWGHSRCSRDGGSDHDHWSDDHWDGDSRHHDHRDGDHRDGDHWKAEGWGDHHRDDDHRDGHDWGGHRSGSDDCHWGHGGSDGDGHGSGHDGLYAILPDGALTLPLLLLANEDAIRLKLPDGASVSLGVFMRALDSDNDFRLDDDVVVLIGKTGHDETPLPSIAELDDVSIASLGSTFGLTPLALDAFPSSSGVGVKVIDANRAASGTFGEYSIVAAALTILPSDPDPVVVVTSPNPVPEPPAAILFGGASLLAYGLHRRRRRAGRHMMPVFRQIA